MKSFLRAAVTALAAAGLSCAGSSHRGTSGWSPGTKRYSGPGIRAGMITTINERGTVYEDGPTAGVCRAGTVSDSLLYELSADAALVESVSGASSAMIYALRMDLLLARWHGSRRTLHPYLLVGGGGMHSVAEGTSDASETVGAADVGIGVLAAESGWDVRLLGTAAIGSNNIEMLASLTLGKRF